MAITQAMCTSFKEDLFQKEQDLGLRILSRLHFTLHPQLWVQAQPHTATSKRSDSGTGYTAGGNTLTGATIGTSGTTAYVDFDDPEWTSASFTARGALIYNDTLAGNNSIAVLDFGGDFTVSSGTFRIVFPAAGTAAILRID